MKNKDLIYIKSVPEISMDYALDHIEGNSWSDAGVAPSRLNQYGEKFEAKDIRNASIAGIDKDFFELLMKTVDPIVKDYAKDHSIEINDLESFHLARYTPGQFFKDHTDRTEEFPRKISAVVYLNDNYEGGKITFTKLGLSFKPSASTVFIFPSTEEFSHFAEPVAYGIKYVIVGFWV